jgi:hypothetical protein
MCRVSEWSLSQASLTSLTALTALCKLRTTHPTLHKALNQTDTVSEGNSDVAEEAFTEWDLYDDCDTPLNVVTDLLRSGDVPAVATNFKVVEKGGITHVGSMELPDAEDAEPEAWGYGLRKKTATRCYLGPAWEEHQLLFFCNFSAVFFVKSRLAQKSVLHPPRLSKFEVFILRMSPSPTSISSVHGPLSPVT